MSVTSDTSRDDSNGIRYCLQTSLQARSLYFVKYSL